MDVKILYSNFEDHWFGTLHLAEANIPVVPNAVLGFMIALHVTYLTYTGTLISFSYLKGTPDYEYSTFQQEVGYSECVCCRCMFEYPFVCCSRH